MSGPNTTFTFQALDVWLGEFRLPPNDPGWRRPNVISERAPLIAFPRTAVAIHQEGRPKIVADPMRAVLYQAGQPYRRELVSAEGDRCSFITFSRVLTADAATAFDPAALDPASYRFPFVTAPIRSDAYLLQHRVRRRISGGEFDPDQIREALYGILASVLRSGYQAAGATRGNRRSVTARDHAEAVDSIRKGFGRDPAARTSLDELAASVQMSPFHLSRVFREQTGRSIHAYRTEVRLRSSLDSIADGRPITDVALDLGFASHAHFTDRFRRAYGIAPHGLRQMSKSVKARSGVGRIA